MMTCRKTAISVSFLLLVSSLYAMSASETIPEFKSHHQVNKWIYNHIEYVDVGKRLGEEQKPAETLELMSGNCLDMAFLFLALAYQAGLEGDMRAVPVYLINEGFYHVLVEAGGVYYDPTSGEHFDELPWIYAEVDWQGEFLD